MSGESRRADGVDTEAHLADLDGSGMRVGIVAGRFNDVITTVLVEAAIDRLTSLGVARGDIALEWVPGAFETSAAAKWMADQGFDAVITLGCVIRGDTAHFDFVAGAAATGALEVSLATGVPVVFGVLTTETLEQAAVRADVDGQNKGGEAAETAVEMVALRRRY
jgi:6,7-dimethyl-8-ribityllumazine synthase